MGFGIYEQKESMETEVVPVEADGLSMENQLMEVTKESNIRLELKMKPFTNCEVDFAGPYLTKQ
jgi:hypothetical protein